MRDDQDYQVFLDKVVDLSHSFRDNDPRLSAKISSLNATEVMTLINHFIGGADNTSQFADDVENFKLGLLAAETH